MTSALNASTQTYFGAADRSAQLLGRPAGQLGKAQAWVQFGGSKREAREISRSGPDQARPPGGLSRLRGVVAPFENGVPPRYALSWICGRVQRVPPGLIKWHPSNADRRLAQSAWTGVCGGPFTQRPARAGRAAVVPACPSNPPAGTSPVSERRPPRRIPRRRPAWPWQARIP